MKKTYLVTREQLDRIVTKYLDGMMKGGKIVEITRTNFKKCFHKTIITKNPHHKKGGKKNSIKFISNFLIQQNNILRINQKLPYLNQVT